MDVILADFGETAHWAQRALHWVRKQMTAQVIFGCPIQKAKEPTRSWWHVPLTLKRRLLSSPTLKGCRVYVKVDADNLYGEIIPLRWFSEDNLRGVTSVDLRCAEWQLIPVVMREGGSSRNAYITDHRFMDDQEDRAHAIRPKIGKHNLRLLIRAGKVRERSQWFMVRNYDMQSNGHFTLEVLYEGLGMDALYE